MAYSAERKAAVRKKMLPPNNVPLRQLSRGQARTVVRTAAQLEPNRGRLAKPGTRQRRLQNQRRRMTLPDNYLDKHRGLLTYDILIKPEAKIHA